MVKPIIIETQRFEDFRGWLSASAEEFHGVQINQGFSKKAGTLRGLHFQEGKHAWAKLISCLRGPIFNVAVDIRPGDTFGYAHGEMRNDWNCGNAMVPNSAGKERFIEKTVRSAERKNIECKKAKVAASRYIEKMKSYPIRDEKMLENLMDGLFNIVYIGKGRVEGECTRTIYFRLILQKQSKKV